MALRPFWARGILFAPTKVLFGWNHFPVAKGSRSYVTHTTPSLASGSGQRPRGDRQRRTGGLFVLTLIFTSFYGVYTLSQLLRQYPELLKQRFKRWRASVHEPDYEMLQPGQIRVLVLAPGKDSVPIHCHLEHVWLAENPEFEALSYVWGNASNVGEISCAGKTIHVGSNLHGALRNLRLPDSERILWVDALCINQSDALEKARQIPLMGRIYEHASRVVIWLGEPTEHSRLALQTLRQLNAYLSARLRWYSESYRSTWMRGYLSTKFPTVAALTRQQAAEVAAFNWTAVAGILSNQWFQRVWVFQEFAKATKAVVVVGKDEMALSEFMRPIAEMFLQQSGREIMGPHLTREAWKSLSSLIPTMILGTERDGLRSGKLLELVAEGRTREATDARDKIYAFRDLAHDFDEGDWEIVPDYTASVEEVYLRFARWCLLRKKDLRCLQYCTENWGSALMNAGRTTHLPSWVPEWGRAGMRGMVLSDYNASLGSKPWISWTPDEPNVLQIKGRIVDRVEEVSVSRLQLITLDSFEFTNKTKFGTPRFRRLVKLLKYWNLFTTEGEDVPMMVDLWREAHDAKQRFGSDKIPDHELMNVVCMENYKHIASKGTGEFTAERFEEFWRTMACGKTGRHPSKTRFSAYMMLLDDIRQGKKITKRLPGTAYEMPRQRQALAMNPSLRYQRRMLPNVQNVAELKDLQLRLDVHTMWSDTVQRRFSSTVKNRLGWVPLTAKAGDIICVFDGAEVPFVLRPKRGEASNSLRRVVKRLGWNRLLLLFPRPAGTGIDTRYELVGECYLHGIMNGEAMKMKDVKEHIFELC